MSQRFRVDGDILNGKDKEDAFSKKFGYEWTETALDSLLQSSLRDLRRRKITFLRRMTRNLKNISIFSFEMFMQCDWIVSLKRCQRPGGAPD